MSKLFCFITFYSLVGLIVLTHSEYEPPKSIGYPFGDEILNADIKEDRVPDEAREINAELIKDIYTFCPNKTEDQDRDYEEIPYNDNQCGRCDVRPTVDKTGALVECYNCSDVSFVTTATEESGDHILFLTTYLEISNYTVNTQDSYFSTS